jgi:hypothetical protein
MTPIWWMAAAGVVCWMAVVAVGGVQSVVEASLGLAAPLAAASVTWVLVERVYKASAARLTPLMIGAFFVKLLFFGVYVAFVLKGLSRRPLPFVASFASCFIAVHLVEALCLQRLFSGGKIPNHDASPGLR